MGVDYASTCMALSRDQKNGVFSEIRAQGLEPVEFIWEKAVVAGPVESHRLVHQAADLGFTFESEVDAVGAPDVTRVIAGLPGPVGRSNRVIEVAGWRAQVNEFRLWLDRLKQELEVPDLWAALVDQYAVFSAAADPSVEDTPFTDSEREMIATTLNGLAAEMKQSFALTTDSIKLLDAGVEKLIYDSEHLTRKDWLLQFIGVMLVISVTAAIPHLLPALLASFGHLRDLFIPGPLGLPGP